MTYQNIISNTIFPIVLSILEVIVVILPILIGVAYVTIAERKGMGSMQRRLGPNAVGIYGLLQPFADALKLIVKENIVPVHANSFLFYFGPIITLIFALLGWAIIPFGPGLTIGDLSLGVVYSLAISSLAGYGILIAGWAANSKYAFMGSLRSTAQIISYELVLSSAILVVIFLAGSFNFSKIIELQKSIWFIIPLAPIFLIFFIGALAETNRAPMDLAEAESELTAGFFTEHSSTIFVFFFLAEYANIMLISSLSVLFFLGGFDFTFGGFIYPFDSSSLSNFGDTNSYINSSNGFFDNFSISYFFNSLLSGLIFGLKVTFLVFLFVWVRASFPRIRYDQLMTSCWTVILPMVFAFIFLIPCILYTFDLFMPNIIY